MKVDVVEEVRAETRRFAINPLSVPPPLSGNGKKRFIVLESLYIDIKLLAAAIAAQCSSK